VPRATSYVVSGPATGSRLLHETRTEPAVGTFFATLRPPIPPGVRGLGSDQSSRPNSGSAAEKRIAEHVGVISAGVELPEPGLMSLTLNVPASVPSLCHSSTPLIPSSA
jgi:hypothetical protein